MLKSNDDLRVPHEIGCYIAAQIPRRDFDRSNELPWAIHRAIFEGGPIPHYHQMKQGLLLIVINYDQCPKSIYTRYGEWIIFHSRSGSFEKIFQIVKEKLNLKKWRTYQTKQFLIGPYKIGMENPLNQRFSLTKKRGSLFLGIRQRKLIMNSIRM